MGKRSRALKARRQSGLSAPEQAPRVSFWVVAFLDLLGYRTTLERIDIFPLPKTPEERERLEANFARAIRLRRHLIKTVEQFLKTITTTAPTPDISKLSPEAQRTFTMCRRTSILSSPGPDHVVIGCPLDRRPDHFPIRGVFALIAAASSAMLIQLTIGSEEGSLPIRGGIDVAPGTILKPEGFLYSPALTRAYDLERKEAVYPRTIAGERLIGYLKASVSDTNQTPEANISRALAKDIQKFFFVDRDGKSALDFFGEASRALVPDERAREWAKQAWDFVRQSHDKHRESGDDSIANKYAWLENYMRDRLSLWGIRELQER